MKYKVTLINLPSSKSLISFAAWIPSSFKFFSMSLDRATAALSSADMAQPIFGSFQPVRRDNAEALFNKCEKKRIRSSTDYVVESPSALCVFGSLFCANKKKMSNQLVPVTLSDDIRWRIFSFKTGGKGNHPPKMTHSLQFLLLCSPI